MNILFLLIGLIAGVIIGWLLVKVFSPGGKGMTSPELEQLQKQAESLNTEKLVSEEKVRGLQENLDQTRLELSAKMNDIVLLNSQLAARNADFKNLSERLEQNKNEMSQLQDQFTLRFKNLANEILEEKTQKFTDQNRTRLDEILKPFSEKLKDLGKKVEETYDKEAQQRFSLKEEIKRLAELNQQISKEASNLTNALKGQSKTQGNWGEIILESILERSGLVRDREYIVQASQTLPDGRRLQPDVVVRYPGDRYVVIDSKVSLVAYERFVSAESKEEQAAALIEHIQSVRNHIAGLSGKNYQDLYGIKGLDFVMMFMPVEPSYLAALQKDPELWNYAYERHVLLISPTNLIAALRMINSMWKQELQTRNVMEIAEQSGALYDKFVGLVDELTDLGKKLEQAQNAYQGTMKKLSEGRGSLVKRAEDIRKLGAKTKKVLPQGLIDLSLNGDETTGIKNDREISPDEKKESL
jgi:DNA recombination protein RmuC